jgi:hypothetical protein
MGAEVPSYSQLWDAAIDREGLFTHVQAHAGRRRRELCDRNPVALARLDCHWNRLIGSRICSKSNCGMQLASVSCSDALHPRVGQPNQEAA